LNGVLPATLISFLENSQIIKVGCAVQQDLDRLAKETKCGPFRGGLDLAQLAKDLKVIPDARMGLADLCARLLGQKLEKPQTIQISNDWDNQNLSPAQVEYAALDALASLAIHTKLIQIQPHRCRRIVPPPRELYDAVSHVFQLYGPQNDSKTNNAQVWHDAKNVLKAIHLGLLSDPPGVQLYQMGIDKKSGLKIFRCARGANNPEGSIHNSLRNRMPKSGVSIRHAASRVKDYVFIHTLVVGTLNRSGTAYRGHYNVGVLNRLQLSLEDSPHPVPNAPMLKGWVNGNLYVDGGETIGIHPIPETTRGSADSISHSHPDDPQFKHAYLARQQNAKYAVITVHSVEEKMFFTELMQKLPVFNRPNDQPPDWKKGACE
jgi:hypothetical protein